MVLIRAWRTVTPGSAAVVHPPIVSSPAESFSIQAPFVTATLGSGAVRIILQTVKRFAGNAIEE
jgi:hypothetical protein